jgi:hypothetical protein
MQSDEVNRILSMPVCHPLTDEEADAYSQMNILADAYADGFRLMPKQAEAVLSYEQYSGPFLPIGVGGGKTGVSLMIPEKAYCKGLRKMMLIIPSAMVAQLWQNDVPFWRKRTPISYPMHLLAGRTKKERMAIAKRGRPGLYILSDSYLSTTDAVDLLEQIRPEIIVVDEAHVIAGRDSARAKRLQGYIEEFKPEFVPMSGTMTRKSILDYFFLVKHALRTDSFLPRPLAMVKEWSGLLDADATKDDIDTSNWNPGALTPLILWAQKQLPGEKMPPGVAGFRRAFAHRMSTCPGVVCSDGQLNVDSSLLLKNNRMEAGEVAAYEGYDKVQHFGSQVEDLMVTPNGDELEHPMLKWKWQYQIYGAGFYTELVWPEVEALARELQCSESSAESYLKQAVVHLEKTQEYHRALRSWFGDSHVPGLDTPALVGANMYHHGDRDVGYYLFEKWEGKNNSVFPELELMVNPAKTDMFGRHKRAVRLCGFKVDQALKWARTIAAKGEGAIIWVYHIEMGLWMNEVLKKAGLPVLYCPAGGVHNSRIIDHGNSKRIIVASMRAHGQGKNLQHFQHQWFLQWPRSANMAEQVLGRLHRKGQKADVVVANTANSSPWDDMIFAATLNDALYIHQTTMAPNRLIIGNYDPIPKVFPSEVLREKIENVKSLDPAMRRLFQEKFGKSS